MPSQRPIWLRSLTGLVFAVMFPLQCVATIETGLVLTTIFEPWAAMAKYSFDEGAGGTVHGTVSRLRGRGATSKAVYLYCEAEWARLEGIRANFPREKQCDSALQNTISRPRFPHRMIRKTNTAMTR